MLVPALDKKLRMRGSNEHGLSIGTRKQLGLSSNCGAKNAIHDRSPPLWDQLHSLMDRRMWRYLEKEKLVQPQAHDVTKIDFEF
jgi:hypothetical protein